MKCNYLFLLSFLLLSSSGYSTAQTAASYPARPIRVIVPYPPGGSTDIIARAPYRLVINPTVPANTMQEFIALAKAKPGSMNYGSAGAGSAVHLAAELLLRQTGVQMTHVPYKGSGPAIVDLIAGQIQMVLGGTLSTAPQTKAGRVRALAVTSLKRRADAPDLPTINETVVPG